VSRRDKAHLRCARCRMHGTLCICALIPRIETRTRLVLVIHRYEERKPTNTGQLAVAALANSEVVVRGHEGEPSVPLALPPGGQPVFLFPDEDALPIAELACGTAPVTLIVPDGTWRQARKVRSRVPGLRDVPCVSLPAGGAPSAYRLRVDAHPHGLATIEAIARAFGVLEGDRGASVQTALEGVFQTMVERTLWARGGIDAGEVTGGIPEGVKRHDLRRTSS
jgi:DTW domain-containing protein YfiP